MDQNFKPPHRGKRIGAGQIKQLQDAAKEAQRVTGTAGLRTGIVPTRGLGGLTLDSSIYQPFYARLIYKDDRDAPTLYAFVEVARDVPDQGLAEPGNWRNHVDGRFSVVNDLNNASVAPSPRTTGGLFDGVNVWAKGTIDIPAYEVKGVQVPDADITSGDAIVQMWLGYDSQTYYLFEYFPCCPPVAPLGPFAAYTPGKIWYVPGCQLQYHCPDAKGKPTVQTILRRSDVGVPGGVASLDAVTGKVVQDPEQKYTGNLQAFAAARG